MLSVSTSYCYLCPKVQIIASDLGNNSNNKKVLLPDRKRHTARGVRRISGRGVDRHTDTSENITFPILRMQAVKIKVVSNTAAGYVISKVAAGYVISKVMMS